MSGSSCHFSLCAFVPVQWQPPPRHQNILQKVRGWVSSLAVQAFFSHALLLSGIPSVNSELGNSGQASHQMYVHLARGNSSENGTKHETKYSHPIRGRCFVVVHGRSSVSPFLPSLGQKLNHRHPLSGMQKLLQPPQEEPETSRQPWWYSCPGLSVSIVSVFSN